MGNFCLCSPPFWKIYKISRSQGPRKSKMLANLWNLGVNASKNAHSVHVLKCVPEDEGCREQWSSLGGHVSGHQHIISYQKHHQHHHHHYYIQFNHYYSIMSSDAKYEVLRVNSLKQHTYFISN